ncbi:protein CBFA2T3-like, partial [Tropilaelaps mercedesae]
AAKGLAPSEYSHHLNHHSQRGPAEPLKAAQRPPTAAEGNTTTTTTTKTSESDGEQREGLLPLPLALEDPTSATTAAEGRRSNVQAGTTGSSSPPPTSPRTSPPRNKTPPRNAPIKERPRACTSPTTVHATSTTSSGVLPGVPQVVPLRPESADGTSSGTAAGGPPACSLSRSALGVRQLAKVKRFLVTLQQFGNDISPDVGDAVHHLIFALVCGNVTVAEFQARVQEATSYPLRPFVVPFLRANLPLMQAELMALARTNKQSPQQYLRTNEAFILDPLCQAGEPFEIFHPEAKENNNTTTGMKRPRCDLRSKDDSLSSKRVRVPTAYSSAYLGAGTLRPFDGNDRHEVLTREPPFQNFASQLDLRCDAAMEDVLRNIYNMLNCIVGMVEKTKRAVCALQRGQTLVPTTQLTALGDIPLWSGEVTAEKKRSREFADPYGRGSMTMSFNNPAGDLENRVSEVRKRAEEAVAEVKRHAVLELQRALAAAESRTSELLAAERAKVDCIQLLSDTTPSTENCFNCGRRASETCSGCSWARYCGAFCQHKDWEQHHRVCGTAAA